MRSLDRSGSCELEQRNLLACLVLPCLQPTLPRPDKGAPKSKRAQIGQFKESMWWGFRTIRVPQVVRVPSQCFEGCEYICLLLCLFVCCPCLKLDLFRIIFCERVYLCIDVFYHGTLMLSDEVKIHYILV